MRCQCCVYTVGVSPGSARSLCLSGPGKRVGLRGTCYSPKPEASPWGLFPPSPLPALSPHTAELLGEAGMVIPSQ